VYRLLFGSRIHLDDLGAMLGPNHGDSNVGAQWRHRPALIETDKLLERDPAERGDRAPHIGVQSDFGVGHLCDCSRVAHMVAMPVCDEDEVHLAELGEVFDFLGGSSGFW